MNLLSLSRYACASRQLWRLALEGFRRTDGTAAIEFAFVFAPLVALILAILDIGILFAEQAALETAVELSARLVLTGQATGQGLTAAQFTQTVCNNLPSAFTCGGVMVDLETATSFSSVSTGAPTLTYDANGNVTNAWQFQPGGPGDIEVMRVMYQWPVVPGPLGLNFANLSNGSYLLMATAVFRNEP